MALDHREVHSSSGDQAMQLQVGQKVGCDATEQQVRSVQALVCKGLTHSVSNVLGADAEDVEQLLGLSAAGDTAYCQPGYNNAGLLANS